MPTKTELHKMKAAPLRALLSEHFDGITDETPKGQLTNLVDEHWDEFLDAELNPVDESAPEPGRPNPGSDLYSGRIRPR